MFGPHHGQRPVTLSLVEMCAGAVGPDGAILDAGTGLSRPALLGAIGELEGQRLLAVQRRRTPGGRDLPSSYALGRPALVAGREEQAAEESRLLTRPARGSDLGGAPIPAAQHAPGSAGGEEGVKDFDSSSDATRIDQNQESKISDSTGFDSVGNAQEVAPAHDAVPSLDEPAAAAALSPDPLILAPALARRMREWTQHLVPGSPPTAVKANVTRALRLYGASGLEEAAFAALLDLAGARTQTRLGRAGARPVANPSSYFFTVLARLLADHSPAVSPEPAAHHPAADAPPRAPLPPAEAPPPGPAAPAAQGADLPTADSPGGLPPAPAGAAAWLTVLRLAEAVLPADDYRRILRYTQLLGWDAGVGEIRLGVPSAYMRAELTGRLAAPVCALLRQVYGQPIRFQVEQLGGPGTRAAGPCPGPAPGEPAPAVPSRATPPSPLGAGRGMARSCG